MKRRMKPRIRQNVRAKKVPATAVKPAFWCRYPAPGFRIPTFATSYGMPRISPGLACVLADAGHPCALQSAIAVWYFVQILLVKFLSIVKFDILRDFSGDCPPPGRR